MDMYIIMDSLSTENNNSKYKTLFFSTFLLIGTFCFFKSEDQKTKSLTENNNNVLILLQNFNKNSNSNESGDNYQNENINLVAQDIRNNIFNFRKRNLELDLNNNITNIRPISYYGVDESSASVVIKTLSDEYKVEENEMTRIWNNVLKEHERTNLDPFLLLALIETESSFKKDAKSWAGAVGLTQVIPRWHQDKIKDGETLTNIDVSVRVGADTLNEYLQREDGDVIRALQRYNGSLNDDTRKYSFKVLKKKRDLKQLYYDNITLNQNNDKNNNFGNNSRA